MAKEKKNKPDWKKVGRNSKNKGRAYERRIADALGWTRVPFSGASRDWGEGDVIDGYYKRNGFWKGECKKQKARKSGDIVIQQDWLEQIAAGLDKSRVDVIFTQTHGSPVSFVFLPVEAWIKFGHQWQPRKQITIPVVPQGNKERGFKVFREDLDLCKDHCMFFYHPTTGAPWRVMRFELFRDWIHEHELMVYEDEAGG